MSNPVSLHILKIDNGYLLTRHETWGERKEHCPDVDALLKRVKDLFDPAVCTCVGKGSQLPKSHRDGCPYPERLKEQDV